MNDTEAATASEPKIIGYVYIFIDEINNIKLYVGSTNNIKMRLVK